jgi:hypothetical protein
MKEGTISVLWGCHSPIHSFLVLCAWIRLYKRLPRPWQIVCIFIHDIGHWQKDYLTDVEQKYDHWILGAYLAFCMFGKKGYAFVAGHYSYSGYPLSLLYKADKYSWTIAPIWWLWLNYQIEPKLKLWSRRGSTLDKCHQFRQAVRNSIESDKWIETHSIYTQGKDT